MSKIQVNRVINLRSWVVFALVLVVMFTSGVVLFARAGPGNGILPAQTPISETTPQLYLSYIQTAFISPLVTPEQGQTVRGKVTLERRTSSAGAQICVDERCRLTLDDGAFSFDNVTAGDHLLTADHKSYLRSWHSISVEDETITLPDVTLLGGDINRDDIIELIDGELIGLAWNSTAESLHWDERADITADGSINVLDMVAVQYNWDVKAPGPWVGALTAMPELTESHMGATSADNTQEAIQVYAITQPALGKEVELDIQVEEVSDLYAAHLRLTFDPTTLRVQDADPRDSAPGIQIHVGDFLDPFNQFILVNEVDNSIGIIDFAVTQLAPALARSGSGVLAMVPFEVKGESSSEVALISARLLDDNQPDPEEIPSAVCIPTFTDPFEQSIYMPLLLRPAAS
ncbi:MAG: hypothetical protein GY759_04360 [Chloroflexi bacterium]|nr:hypothetical protein [Chloroflexota bacterium]